jgi:hypothetical protein
MKPRSVCSIVSVLAVACLSGCDVDVFGVQQKKIARDYRLYADDSDHGFAIFEPGTSSGPGIAQIGWRAPYILADVRDGERHWQLFDTSTRSSRFLSDSELRADSRLADIPIMSAKDAWARLSHFRNQW